MIGQLRSTAAEAIDGREIGRSWPGAIYTLSDLLGAIAAEAKWLADGDDTRFMSDVALRLQR